MAGGRIRCLAQAFSDLRNGGGPIVDRGGEVVDWLSQRADVDGGRVGVIGFCLGGGRDRFLRKDPPRVARVLNSAGVPNDLRVYPTAGHSFANQPKGHGISRYLARPYMAIGYDEAAADDTWSRIAAFFAEHV